MTAVCQVDFGACVLKSARPRPLPGANVRHGQRANPDRIAEGTDLR